MTARRIGVFCGASAGAHPEFVEAAAAMGRAMADRGIELIYGGASVGTMGALADAALAAGGSVVGVIPTWLIDREIAHAALSELVPVATLAERKEIMIERADAFIALPGGLGTFDELFEVLTTSALGLHAKPCAVLDVRGFYQPLLAALDRAVTDGFLAARLRNSLIVAADAEALLARLDR